MCVCVFTELIQYLGSLFQVFVVEVVDESCPTHAHTHTAHTHTHTMRATKRAYTYKARVREVKGTYLAHTERTRAAPRHLPPPPHTHTHTGT